MTAQYALKTDYAESSDLLTGKELFVMKNIGRTELVKGELVSMSPTGYTHGRVELKFGRIIDTFVEQHGIGQVFVGEVGIYTGRNPDTVRGADVIYISNERLAHTQSESYLDVAPELIVEILSPNDRWSDVMDKLDEYFSIGVQEVWIADPRHKHMFVYSSPTDVKRLTADEKLSGGKILPGFEAVVAELFGAVLQKG
ncbi:MAG: Uma2 family endonuclease [Desulfobacterales bacterium]|nr:Uma2 family endonuclease [Desulfobacterales bacterium]